MRPLLIEGQLHWFIQYTFYCAKLSLLLPHVFVNINILILFYQRLKQICCLCLNGTDNCHSKLFETRRVDGNADISSHPGPSQHPLPRGHIVIEFYIRASYWLPSLSFHDNQASHSRDTIWKGKGQRYPSQRSVQLTYSLSVSHQGILSTPVPFVPWQSGHPFSR